MKLREKIFAQKRLKQAQLYCITSGASVASDLPVQIEAAARGGADLVQLREKKLSDGQLLDLIQQTVRICEKYQTLLIVNDRLDLALAGGAHGVHLGQDDLPLPVAREMVQKYFKDPSAEFLIGCSTHSLQQARAAEAEGADYLGCGPIFATPTKPGVVPVGLQLIQDYRREIKIPFVAIGGMDQTNLSLAIQAGATCVAVVRAAFSAPNIEQAVRALKEKISL